PTGEPINNRWFGQSSFAKHAVATQRNVVVIDPDLPLELLGPLGCGVLTGAGAVLNEMRLLAGQSIVVFGAGAVGLSAIMAARAAGANDIVAVDVNLARLRLAEELGATRTFQAGTEDLVARVRGKSTGVDFAFDTTGVPSAMRAAIETLTMPGKAVFVGAGNDLTIPPMLLAGRTLTYVLEGSAVPRVLIPHLLDLWRAGAFPFEKMITTFPLSEINQAEHACRNGEVVKPVLLP
ncbi:zinc-binding dehydrogenase, partial [Rhodococcus koreensis]